MSRGGLPSASRRPATCWPALLLLAGRCAESLAASMRWGSAPARSSQNQGSMHGVRYQVSWADDHVAHVQLNLSNVSLSLMVDRLNRNASIDGGGAVLSPRHKESLFSFSGWRAMKYGVEDLLSRLTAYAADSPTQHAFKTSRARGRSELRCLREGQPASALWMDSNQSLHNVSVVVGSTAGPAYGCMGRCGKGCPKHNKSNLVYTQNCLNHDQCSWEMRSRNGMRDKDCGDAYKRAMADYLWGDKMCRWREKKKMLDELRGSSRENGSNVSDTADSADSELEDPTSNAPDTEETTEAIDAELEDSMSNASGADEAADAIDSELEASSSGGGGGEKDEEEEDDDEEEEQDIAPRTLASGDLRDVDGGVGLSGAEGEHPGTGGEDAAGPGGSAEVPPGRDSSPPNIANAGGPDPIEDPAPKTSSIADAPTANRGRVDQDAPAADGRGGGEDAEDLQGTPSGTAPEAADGAVGVPSSSEEPAGAAADSGGTGEGAAEPGDGEGSQEAPCAPQTRGSGAAADAAAAASAVASAEDSAIPSIPAVAGAGCEGAAQPGEGAGGQEELGREVAAAAAGAAGSELGEAAPSASSAEEASVVQGSGGKSDNAEEAPVAQGSRGKPREESVAGRPGNRSLPGAELSSTAAAGAGGEGAAILGEAVGGAAAPEDREGDGSPAREQGAEDQDIPGRMTAAEESGHGSAPAPQ